MFSPFTKSGPGLHTGRHSEVLVEMGLPGSGTLFIVDDFEIPAAPAFISQSHNRATALTRENKSVSTTEHLMAALAAFGETDARIFVEGDEIPILDGSAMPWVEALLDSGAEPGPRFVGISREICVDLGDSKARLVPLGPDRRPVIKVSIDFSNAFVGRQAIWYHPKEDDFVEEVAPARTFALESEVAAILDSGLARGGSLDCAVIIGPSGPLNPGGLRFPDEPVRHKLLDAIGDLALIGGLPWATVELERPGHRLLHELASKAFDCLISDHHSARKTEPGDAE